MIDYRARIEAVDTAAIAAAARAHLHVDDAAIVLVGDVDAFGEALEAANLGQLVIDRDEGPVAAGPLEPEAAMAPVDDEDATGPTVGAEEPDLPGLDEEPAEG